MPTQFGLRVFLAVLVCLAGAAGTAAGEPAGAPGGIAWAESLSAAQEAGKAQARPVLVFFHTDG